MMTNQNSGKKSPKKKPRKKTSRRKNTPRTLSAKSRKVFRQCASCGGIVDQKYGKGDGSWCPLCFDYDSIHEKIGELPDPQMYGSWLATQEEAEKKKRKAAAEKSHANASFENSAPKSNFFGGANMKTVKKHTGLYSCPKCCVEFDLFMDEDLKCDRCGEPLVAGTLDQYFVDDDDSEF
jgi:hypothetical protein